MSIILTGGAEIPRNHYFNLHWNSYSIKETNYRRYSHAQLPNRFIVQRLLDGYIDASIYATEFLKISAQKLGKFAITSIFYYQLMMLDDDLKRVGFVYLLQFKDYFKIGKTNDIDQRYDATTKKNLIYLIPVTNQDDVETELINRFRSEGYKIHKGNEYFKYENFDDVKIIFNDVTAKRKVNIDGKKSKLLAFTKFKGGNNKMWFHPKVGKIFINKFALNDEIRDKMLSMNRSIEGQINNGYFDEIYDVQNHSICSFWVYFGYVTIKRWTDQKVNASRLMNSIKKIDGDVTHRTITDFIQQCERDKNLMKDFKDSRPGYTMYELEKNIDQPYLSGYYIDILLVPYFTQWVSTKHRLRVAEILLSLDPEISIVLAKPLTDDEKRKRIHKKMYLRKLIDRNQTYGLQ